MKPEYDPERALWKPGRRSFFFGLGGFLLAPALFRPPTLEQYAAEMYKWRDNVMRYDQLHVDWTDYWRDMAAQAYQPATFGNILDHDKSD